MNSVEERLSDDAETDEITDDVGANNTLAGASHGVYLRSAVKLLTWLYGHKRRHLLTREFLEALQRYSSSSRRTKRKDRQTRGDGSDDDNAVTAASSSLVVRPSATANSASSSISSSATAAATAGSSGQLDEADAPSLPCSPAPSSSFNLQESVVRQVLLKEPTIAPLRFDDFTARDFLTWINTLRKRNGERPGFSTFNSHRAALFNLYRGYGKTVPRTFEAELKSHYKGLKRKTSTSIIREGIEIPIAGKDPLPFGLYKFLVLEMLKMKTRDYIFARTFLIISWNLMCRAGNAVSIRLDHIDFSCDAMRIYPSHMKDDQFGKRPRRDPRHVYANPLSPAVCPILAIGIYWLCFPFQTTEERLFQGNSQSDRFRKILAKCLRLPHVMEELETRGIQPDDLGSHSVRKGAAIYASSGSPSAPSSTAIQFRAGWVSGGVQDTSLRYEPAGDMYVGRTVSGLPLDKPEFAMLPPHFKGCDRDKIKQALDICYPGLPPNLRRTGEFALASVLYHATFLRETVPASHPLLQTVPFRSDIPVIEELRRNVVCGMSQLGDDSLRATGVPAHVSVMAELREVCLQVKEGIRLQAHQQAEVKRNVVDDIVRALEGRALGGTSSTVTAAGLRDTIMECFTEAGASTLRNIGGYGSAAQATNSHQGEKATSSTPTADDNRTMVGTEGGGGGLFREAVYMWGGTLHHFPEDFHLPNGTVANAWQLWCCGDAAKRFPPLKRLLPHDLKDKSERKRLSEYKYLMLCIEKKAEELGLRQPSSWTIEEAIRVFTLCEAAVEVRDMSEKQRKRRKTQLSWVTVATLKRKEERENRSVPENT